VKKGNLGIHITLKHGRPISV